MKHRAVILFVLLDILLLVAIAPLLPFQDDWTYLTAPNPDFSWRGMLPSAVFWRPFDALWGGFLGGAPWLFPWANRIAVVFGHALCVWLAICVIEELCSDRRVKLAALGFFAMSSGIAATIVNTDSINLVWSCIWGCAGTLVLLRGRAECCAFGCFAVSMLCKESGVSWLMVGPVLAYAKDGRWRHLLKRGIVGALTLICYMGLRFALRSEVALGDNGDYALTLSPLTVVRNLAILIGMGMSNIDGLAYFAHRYFLFIGTAVFSLLAWCAYAASVDMKRRIEVVSRLIMGVCVIVAFAAPHCMFKNHHPAEMHFYPVLLGGAFTLAMIPLNETSRVPFSSSVILMTAVFAIGWCDKISTIYASNAKAERLLSKIKADVWDFNVPKEYTVKANKDEMRYSVFMQSPAWCLDYGRALRSQNEWRESKVTIVEE